MATDLSRRAFLIGGVGALSLAAVGGAGAAAGVIPMPRKLRNRFADLGPDGVIPSAPAGQIRLERVRSAARGREVGLWTAVPAGLGAGWRRFGPRQPRPDGNRR